MTKEDILLLLKHDYCKTPGCKNPSGGRNFTGGGLCLKCWEKKILRDSQIAQETDLLQKSMEQIGGQLAITRRLLDSAINKTRKKIWGDKY